jgi:hypothetical protein
MSTKRMTSASLLAGLAIVAVSVHAQEKGRPHPSAGEIEALHQLIKPGPGESRWMEIDWHPSVWEARQKAAIEGKPLFLWAGSGGAPPAGC